MTSRRLFLAKLAGLAGFTLLSKAKGDYTKPLSLPVVMPRVQDFKGDSGKIALEFPAIDYDRLLYCISAVETKHDDTAVGPCGARSRYQISEAVWFQHLYQHHITPFSGVLSSYDGPEHSEVEWREISRRDFLANCHGLDAANVAVIHSEWLGRQLCRAASPYAIAWSWKEGLEAYRLAHSNRSGMSFSVKSALRGHRYGRCVTNLYYDPTYQHT